MPNKMIAPKHSIGKAIMADLENDFEKHDLEPFPEPLAHLIEHLIDFHPKIQPITPEVKLSLRLGNKQRLMIKA